jgi:hypothetical protein
MQQAIYHAVFVEMNETGSGTYSPPGNDTAVCSSVTRLSYDCITPGRLM